MNYLYKLLKILLFTPFFLILVFQISAEDFSSFQNASVLKNTDKMNQLNAVFKDCLYLMHEFSENRNDYFERGLGWQNNDGYGFFSGNKTVYFSETGAGFSVYSNGIDIGQFYCNYSEDIAWITLTIKTEEIINISNSEINYAGEQTERGNFLFIGFNGDTPVTYNIGFSSGINIFLWEDSIQVKYPDEDYFYMLVYNRDEPLLVLSDKLSSIFFYKFDGRTIEDNILDDLQNDFPYPYFTRILSDAYSEEINIKDEQELSGFTISWFREKIGLADLEHSPMLKTAAENHADYLIENKIIYNQMTWDPDTVDLNDYLVLHNETSGMPLFTGESVSDRTVHAGYGLAAGECVTISMYNVINENINWMHTIFHRRPYLDLRVNDFGHGHSVSVNDPNETAGVMNWGYNYYKADGDVYFYPYNGETFVPFAWSAFEAPDPFPGNTHGLGVPITVAFTSSVYKNGTIELLDNNGRPVPCLISNTLEYRDNFIEVTPEYPLLPDTTYTIKFSYNNKSISSVFTTAPLNPAEQVINNFKNSVQQYVELLPDNSGNINNIDFLDSHFDIDNAMFLNNRKGELNESRSGTEIKIIDNKYGFSFDLPEGWERRERDWQEVLLGNSWYSINVHLYAHANNPDPLSVMENQKQYISYKLESTTWVETEVFSGYRLEYSWEFDNKVIFYCLIFGDYALIISGYGVTDSDINTVVSSFNLSE